MQRTPPWGGFVSYANIILGIAAPALACRVRLTRGHTYPSTAHTFIKSVTPLSLFDKDPESYTSRYLLPSYTAPNLHAPTLPIQNPLCANQTRNRNTIEKKRWDSICSNERAHITCKIKTIQQEDTAEDEHRDIRKYSVHGHCQMVMVTSMRFSAFHEKTLDLISGFINPIFRRWTRWESMDRV